MERKNKLISITEYAKMHGKDDSYVRKLCLKGTFKTARKLGRIWVIEADEPYPVDKRLKSGKYKNWRDKTKQKD